MKQKKFLVSHIIIMLIAIILFSIISDIKTKEILLFLIYFYVLYSALNFVDLLNSYMILMYTLALFNLSRIFLDIFDENSFGWATKFANYYFSKSVKEEILFVIILALLFIHLGFLIAVNIHNLDFDIKVKRDDSLIKIAKLLFIISAPMLSIKLFIQFKAILANGYGAQYLGLVKTLEYPIYTYASGSIMTLAFLLFIVSRPNKKEFTIYSSLYLLIKLLDSLKGARALFLTQLLFIIWYYVKEYKPKVKVFDLTKIFLVVLVFSQMLVNFREKKLFSFKLIEMFNKFLFSQGVSYLVLAYVIDLKEQISDKIYIFQGLIGFKPQGFDALNNTNSIADELTYLLDSNAYLKGEGIGSNFLAESYLLGYVLMIIVFILIGYFIILYEIKLGKNRLLILIAPYVIPSLFYIPRGPLFGFGFMRYCIIYVIPAIIIMKGLSLWKKKYQEKLTTSG